MKKPIFPGTLVILLSVISIDCLAADDIWPLPEWTKVRPSDVGMDEVQLQKARDYALTSGGSGTITRHGKLVMSWGDPARRYDLKSTTKSIGVTERVDCPKVNRTRMIRHPLIPNSG